MCIYIWNSTQSHTASVALGGCNGPIVVVKNAILFACFGANRKSANRPGVGSRLTFSDGRQEHLIVGVDASPLRHSMRHVHSFTKETDAEVHP